MRENLARLMLLTVGAFYVFNGAAMWIGPHFWYDTVPGMVMMGPFNSHFVRDISLVYLLGGGVFIIFAKSASDAVLMAALWPAVHAVFHIWIWLTRGGPIDLVMWTNLVAIQTPAWLALWAVLVRRRAKAAAT